MKTHYTNSKTENNANVVSIEDIKLKIITKYLTNEWHNHIKVFANLPINQTAFIYLFVFVCLLFVVTTTLAIHPNSLHRYSADA